MTYSPILGVVREFAGFLDDCDPTLIQMQSEGSIAIESVESVSNVARSTAMSLRLMCDVLAGESPTIDQILDALGEAFSVHEDSNLEITALRDVVERSLVLYLRFRWARVFSALSLVGLVRVNRSPFIDWEGLPLFFESPLTSVVRAAGLTGATPYNVVRVCSMYSPLICPSFLYALPIEEEDVAGLRVFLLPSGEAYVDLGIRRNPETAFLRLVGTVDRSLQLGSYSVRLSALAAVGADHVGSLGARGLLEFSRGGRTNPRELLFGRATSSRVEARESSLVFRAVGTVSGVDWALSGRLRDGVAVIARTDLGAFLSSFISSDVQADFSFSFDATKDGLRFGGDLGLGWRDTRRQTLLNFVTLTSIEASLRLLSSRVELSLGLCLEVSLGPVKLAVGRSGLKIDVSPSSGLGNLGVLNASVGFSGPNSVGVSVTANPVLCSGVVSVGNRSGQYAGALSLSIFGVRVSVVGLFDSSPPGIRGYSFVFVVVAEFSPVQLGFGFTLNGVGGLCGIQRSINIDVLQSGVRDGSLVPMLVVQDPVAQAGRIIAGISSVFPATQDSFVFGPLFKLGWGTPTLVTITLGLVIRLPDPITIALIGQVEVRLPKPEAAIVEVNIDILGLLLPDEKLLSIDARLRDSKVAGWTLTGGMAFRLTWGAEPNFLFSVGGFNPHFRPPPSFPQIERLALALGTGSNPRVSLAAYFAITSNSLQFGARAELYAEALGFSVQGYLEFHALFIFSPFSFRFDFAAGVALKRGSSVIAGITVAGTLSGPRPWRVQGSASISVIFFDVSVSFDETFGQPAEPEQIEAVDAWTMLREALQDLRNWSAPLPVGTHRGVSTAADAETPARLCLDPLSGITLGQKILPLEQRISKLGEAPIVGGASVFRIARVRIGAEGAGGALIDTAPHRDSFAAAQYQPLTDSERLSRPSYEPMIAGVESRADIARSGVGAVVDREWRTEYMHSDSQMPGPASPAAVALMLEMSSAAGGGLSAVGMDRFAAAPGTAPVVSMAPEMWVASSTEDLKPARDQAPSSSYSTAAGSLQVIEGADDSMTFQVVPAWEAA